MALELRVSDPRDLLLLKQKRCDGAGILDMAAHAHAEGLDALENVKRRRRGHTGPKVTKPFFACPLDHCSRTEFFSEN